MMAGIARNNTDSQNVFVNHTEARHKRLKGV